MTAQIVVLNPRKTTEPAIPTAELDTERVVLPVAAATAADEF